MSYTNIDNNLIADKNLNSSEFRIFVYLLQKWNLNYGYSFPTRKQIEETLGIGNNTVNNSLKSLEKKGYITIKKYIHDNGWNNIYYIHKYLVASKGIEPVDVDARTSKVIDNKSEGSEEAPADANIVENIEDVEASTNELLVIQNCKLTKKLTKEDIVELNKMDTDRLLQAINQANKKQGDNAYHINYIKKTYSNIENNPSKPQREAQSNKPSNNSNDSNKSDTGATGEYHNNNYPVRTKYHGTFNEHFRNYAPDELEEKLLKMQGKLRGFTQ